MYKLKHRFTMISVISNFLQHPVPHSKSWENDLYQKLLYLTFRYLMFKLTP